VTTCDETGSREAVNKLNRAMMLQQQLVGELPDHDCSCRVGLDRQQRLVLPWCDPRLPRRSFTERQKSPQG
jgi:hypothetical protein